MEDEPDLRRLVEAFRDPDESVAGAALGALHSHYWPELYRYLRSKVPNHQDAEDLFQEAFTRAWRSRHTFQPARVTSDAFAKWIYRIARNVAIEHWRQRQRLASTTASEVEDSHSPRPQAFAEYHQAIEAVIGAAAQAGGIRPIVAEMLRMRIMGCTNKEIAQQLRMQEATVKKAVQRSHSALRQQIQLSLFVDDLTLELPRGGSI